MTVTCKECGNPRVIGDLCDCVVERRRELIGRLSFAHACTGESLFAEAASELEDSIAS